MNFVQWLAALFIFTGGYVIGWYKGFAIAKYEYFYRGKLKARQEMEANK